ncbi:hypothetical protein L6164_017531 [Bauhinia variegata]|uniref:Uncharacterized protein n=1 Tax=Bauhinia variegata TaxID=167791 RepID=A0ACB9N8E7_BAUVA|nr:hypothetical protein L6164_017531 [Bauhinia variegata]
MEAKLFTSLLILLSSSFILYPPIAARATGKPYQETSTKFIRKTCSATRYPRLCFSSLVKHATFIQTNRMHLTDTALNVTLSSAKGASALILNLSKSHGLKPREVAAINDCVEVLSDSVYELRRSIKEMSHLRSSNFYLTISDVQTWVSAALTDENTCMDGFQGTHGKVKKRVRREIVVAAQLTSNALALINQLAS